MFLRTFLIAALAVVALPAAAQTATQNVTIVVPEVELIDVNDAAKTITFTAPEAGSAFSDATASSTYDITVNTDNNKITGELDAAYETGITLKASLGAPSGASSAGSVELGTTAGPLMGIRIPPSTCATANASSGPCCCH